MIRGVVGVGVSSFILAEVEDDVVLFKLKLLNEKLPDGLVTKRDCLAYLSKTFLLFLSSDKQFFICVPSVSCWTTYE